MKIRQLELGKKSLGLGNKLSPIIVVRITPIPNDLFDYLHYIVPY